ncbi:MAG: hypothetical protein AAF682_07850 [Planctomycetota bacterium]
MNDKRPVHARRLAVLGTALLPLLCTGCLAVGLTERSEFEEAQRTPVKFPSARAADDFHAGLRESDREVYVEANTFVVPFLVARRSELYHETDHYNAEVRRADVDRDGEITEDEARTYLGSVRSGGEGD